MDENNQKNGGLNEPIMPDKPTTSGVICHNCKQRVVPVNMICPECKHYIDENRGPVYQPLSPKTRRIVKTILTIVLLVIFFVLIGFGVINIDGCVAESSLTRSVQAYGNILYKSFADNIVAFLKHIINYK